jgi:hypothetical protein
VYETLYNKSPEELPSVSFVRTCRVLVEVMGEALTAIKLANAPDGLNYGQILLQGTKSHLPH